MLTSFGLSFITIAWLLQLLKLLRQNKKVSLALLGVYALGVILLIIDGFASGLDSLGYYNVSSLLASLAVFLLVIKK